MASLLQAKNRVRSAFQKYVKGAPASTLIPPSAVAGKVYEALVLADVVENLVRQEQMQLTFVGGTKLYLKTSPGPINLSYPHIQASRHGVHVANIFTDVEFTALSCVLGGTGVPCNPGDFHELDIVMVDKGSSTKPRPEEIWLGVECKHTTYGKSLLREALGVRRELSLLRSNAPTRFKRWPQKSVPATPASCLMVCCSDARSLSFASPGNVFGIDFRHVSL